MDVPPIIRKILITAGTGGVTFLITNLTDQQPFPSAVLSLLVGGIVLLSQFMMDFDGRHVAVENELTALRGEWQAAARGFRTQLRSEVAKVGDATALRERLERTSNGVDIATRLASLLPATEAEPAGLAMRVAEAELAAAMDFLSSMAAGGHAAMEGEDRDWLTTLARLCEHSLNAISLCSEGPDGSFSDDGFWNTEIGVRYLELQREAIRRGVRIQRLFVVANDRLAGHPDLITLLDQQREAGVTVRVLQATELPPSRRHHLPDLAIFDEEVSYELTGAPRLDPETPRYFINTRLSAEPDVVRAHLSLFTDYWDAGHDPETMAISR
jgi:hypothetical protein